MSNVNAFNIDEVTKLAQQIISLSLQNADLLSGRQINYHGPVTIQVISDQTLTPPIACNQRLMKHYMKECSEFPGETTVDEHSVLTANAEKLITDGKSSFRLVPKFQWLGRESNEGSVKMELLSTRVIITHTATEECSTMVTFNNIQTVIHYAHCSFVLRLLQDIHMDVQKWADIGYNFIVEGDASVYEGRGWDIQGAHTKGYNEKTVCIALIGTFDNAPPPQRQVNTLKQLIEEGVKLKKLDPNYKLFGHCQLAPFNGPGKKLFEIIKTWPHWSEEL